MTRGPISIRPNHRSWVPEYLPGLPGCLTRRCMSASESNISKWGHKFKVESNDFISVAHSQWNIMGSRLDHVAKPIWTSIIMLRHRRNEWFVNGKTPNTIKFGWIIRISRLWIQFRWLGAPSRPFENILRPIWLIPQTLTHPHKHANTHEHTHKLIHQRLSK